MYILSIHTYTALEWLEGKGVELKVVALLSVPTVHVFLKKKNYRIGIYVHVCTCTYISRGVLVKEVNPNFYPMSIWSPDTQHPVVGAKVVHSPVNKEEHPTSPHSQWSPIRRKPVPGDEACFQCTKRGFRPNWGELLLRTKCSDGSCTVLFHSFTEISMTFVSICEQFK